MAPGLVRTVPPWVLKEPPRSLAPQHNHTPSDSVSRQGLMSRSRDDDRDDDDDDDDNNNEEGLTMASARPATSTTKTTTTSEAARRSTPSSSQTPPGTTSRPGSNPDPNPDPNPPPPPPGPPAPERQIPKLSLLFRGKEGRKWDHLRSAEPVIVPQYHVVNGPATLRAAWEDEDYDSEVGGGAISPKSYAVPGDGASRAQGVSGAAAAAAVSAAAAAAATSTATTTGTSYVAPSSPRATPWWYNPESQWQSFIQSTRYPHLPHEKSEIVNDEEMQRLHPDFGYHPTLTTRTGFAGDGGFGGSGGNGPLQKKHLGKPSKYLRDKTFYQRVWQTLLHHPLGPLACRLTVLSTSIVALVVAAEIFRREHLGSVSSGNREGSIAGSSRGSERTQIIVAIVVDVVAVPYIGYITVDDYTGKPLGLRPPKDRIRLILADLFFIIFKSASTALGFEAMIFITTEHVEGLLRTLAAFELIGLVSWALTLTINIFREIERLGG